MDTNYRDRAKTLFKNIGKYDMIEDEAGAATDEENEAEDSSGVKRNMNVVEMSTRIMTEKHRERKQSRVKLVNKIRNLSST